MLNIMYTSHIDMFWQFVSFGLYSSHRFTFHTSEAN